jgi:hypothetical protein
MSSVFIGVTQRLVMAGRGGRANCLLCRGGAGEVVAVGVTEPPAFLVKRLLKNVARAPSFAAILLPPAAAF